MKMGSRLEPKRKIEHRSKIDSKYPGWNRVSIAAPLCSFLKSRGCAKTKTLISFGNTNFFLNGDNETPGRYSQMESWWKGWQYFGLGTSERNREHRRTILRALYSERNREQFVKASENTLTYPKARPNLKVHMKINLIPWLILKVDSFRKFIWK